MNKRFTVLSPTAILGYGYPLDSFMNGIERSPDLIAVDAGSIDPGPYYLGSGKSFTDRIVVKRDLRYILKEAVHRRIPVIVGSCGGSGAKPHLLWCKEIVEEIAVEESLAFKMGLIFSDVEKDYVLTALNRGLIKPLSYAAPLTADEIIESVHIVAQMGIEPIITALKAKCEVILCGRAYDPAIFAALPIYLGFAKGLALHMGKILECAAIAANPGSGADSVLGVMEENSFTLETLNIERKFTEKSTAAHSLYEKSDPYYLYGPGGRLNLSECRFEEVSPNGVRVTGSKYEESKKYYIKLEGARSVGCRTVCIAGTRDTIMIDKIDSILKAAEERARILLKSEGIKGKLFFHLYGKNGVMGAMEPEKYVKPHELGILIEAIGSTQREANTICSITRSTLLHFGYPGRISTAGNLAFPFSPSDFSAGEVFEFSIYHLMEINNQDVFKIQVIDI